MPNFKLCTGVDDDEDDMPGIFTIMKIGYTFNGKFDPQHIDFRYCCGKLHIHKAMIVTSIIQVISCTLQVVGLFFGETSILEKLSTILSFLMIILAIIAIIYWKKYLEFLKVYLFYLITLLFTQVGYIIYNLVFVTLMASSKKNGEEAVEQEFVELSTLIDVLTSTGGLVLNSWSCFCFYIEYKYLQGRYKNEIL